VSGERGRRKHGRVRASLASLASGERGRRKHGRVWASLASGERGRRKHGRVGGGTSGWERSTGAWRRDGARRGTKDSDLYMRAYYTGLSCPLPLSRLFLRHTGAFVYPVASQTTVFAKTPPLPVVGDFTAATNIIQSSGNSMRQGGRGRRSRRESRRGRGRDWRWGWQG